ncbi:hypothetical protein NliqN6_6664 [Naganishia liquefaciens]|uniref:Secretory protein n=1 Tax=Naganishia liquefaciens TaxID=104408 RepID=A0A8H3TZY9_9TREE|nr:hypothetical protein NliqN6_6664 [Naganishia liquefaciens]
MAPLVANNNKTPFLGVQHTYTADPETGTLQPIPSTALSLSIRSPSPADDRALEFFHTCIPDPAQFLLQQHAQIRAILGSDLPIRYRNVTLAFSPADGLAHTQDDTITLSIPWIASWSTRSVDQARHEFLGVITHELVHVVQYDGAGTAAWWWIEGVADYVRLSLGLAPTQWTKRGEGTSYRDGYGVTAHWLAWITEKKVSARLMRDVNSRLMRSEWREEWIEESTGLTAGTLWDIYKAQSAS